MQTQVKNLIDDTNGTAVSSSDVIAALNAALDFWKNKRFWFNETVDTAVTFTVDTAAIGDMPTDLLYPLQRGGIVLNYQSRRYELTKVSAEIYDMMNAEVSARPMYYTYRSGAYEVYPYPDQAYTGVVRYIKDYTALADDTDTNDFTDNAPWLLIYDASSRIAGDRLQDLDMSAKHSMSADKEYKALMGRTNRLNSTGSHAVY